MGLIDAIAKVRRRRSLDADGKRKEIYALKTGALIDVINDGLLGKKLTHKGYQFVINRAEVTDQPALFLDVTFIKPPAKNPVTHQITIVNPPVLPAEPSGNERQDLIQALHEMLEGFDR